MRAFKGKKIGHSNLIGALPCAPGDLFHNESMAATVILNQSLLNFLLIIIIIIIIITIDPIQKSRTMLMCIDGSKI